MKAYILSYEYGTVQIGNTVFQPSTGAKFKVTNRPKNYVKIVEAKEKSMDEAKKILEQNPYWA